MITQLDLSRAMWAVDQTYLDGGITRPQWRALVDWLGEVPMSREGVDVYASLCDNYYRGRR